MAVVAYRTGGGEDIRWPSSPIGRAVMRTSGGRRCLWDGRGRGHQVAVVAYRVNRLYLEEAAEEEEGGSGTDENHTTTTLTMGKH